MFFYYDEPAEGASDLTICSGSDEKKTSMQGEYTVAELRQVGPLEFRAVPTGNYILTRNGKRKQETVGKEFINTQVGKFELREWYSYMEEAVRREGAEWLLNAIIEHVSTHCFWFHSKKEMRNYALECLSSGAFRSWGFEKAK